MKMFLGQIVHYSYKPDSAPVAAIVTGIQDAEWVSLYLFSEMPRWLPHVEYAVHCKPADPSQAPSGNFYGGIFA